MVVAYSPVKLLFHRVDAGGERTPLATATGFFWSYENHFYLVTNWHNVTGWDPIADKALSKNGAQPTHVQMPLLLRAPDDNGQAMVERKQYLIPLYADDGSPKWLEHPTFGRRVDVIAIEIASNDESVLSKPINLITSFVDFEPVVGNDAFVLGYPVGLGGGGDLAIWKRASIATHTKYDIDGLPKILIDTATRQGMSGAPVIARQHGLITPRNVKVEKEKPSPDQIIGSADTFLGVYSGRIGNDELGAQLGIVWRAAVVEEIIVGKKMGSAPY